MLVTTAFASVGDALVGVTDALAGKYDALNRLLASHCGGNVDGFCASYSSACKVDTVVAMGNSVGRSRHVVSTASLVLLLLLMMLLLLPLTLLPDPLTELIPLGHLLLHKVNSSRQDETLGPAHALQSGDQGAEPVEAVTDRLPPFVL